MPKVASTDEHPYLQSKSDEAEDDLSVRSSIEKLQLEWAMKGNDILKDELQMICNRLEAYLPRIKKKQEAR